MSLTKSKLGSLKDKLKEHEERELAELAKAAEIESKKLKKVGGLKPHRSKLTKPRK